MTLTRTAANFGINRVILALSLARFADALGNSVLFVVIPLYVAYLPAPWFPFPDSVLVGILISLYGFANSAFQPLMGSLTDRMSRRKPFIQGGLLLMGASTLAFIFASRFTDLLLIRSLQGIGVALTIPASLALMTTSSQKHARGGAMGVYTTMRLIGVSIGPLLGGFVYVHYGFNAAFYLGAGAVFLSVLLVHFWVNEVPVDVSAQAARPFKIFERELFGAGIVGVGVTMFLMASAFSMMAALENEFNARLQQTALAFGVAFSALTVSRVIVQLPLGRLSDRIGRKPLIIGGLILMAVSTVFLGEARTTVELIGARLLQGIAAAGIAAPALALTADLSLAGGEGRQMSIVAMGFGLGTAIGPLIAGVLAVIVFELPFYLIAGLLLIGAWIVYHYVPETIQRVP